MGGNSSKISTYLSSTKDENGDRYYAEFDSSWFSQGVSRYAFKGVMKGQGPRNENQCVVKVFKQTYAKSFDEWVPDLHASTEAKKYANKWNKDVIPRLNLTDRRFIDFVVPLIAKVDDSSMEKCFSRKNEYIKPQEYLAIEDYIEGGYVKFNSNGGYEDQEISALLPAFSHWTWSVSGKRFMICDLQGVKQSTQTGAVYHLTDPAIHSTDKIFGMTDLGEYGMETVLASHHCNFICKALGLVNPIPQVARNSFPKKKPSTYDFQMDVEAKNRNKYGTNRFFTPMSAIPDLE